MSTSLQSHPYQLASHTPSARADAAAHAYYTKKASPARGEHIYHRPSGEAHAGPSSLGRSSNQLSPGAVIIRTASSSSSSSKIRSSPGASSPQPQPAHLGSELFDAIVQAADPRHPDHAAWQDRYGSLSNRSSRASVSSGHKRDKFASSPQAGAPSSRKSFDHSDLSARRRHASRKAGNWDQSYRQSSEAGGSDADDFDQDRITSGRTSFEGSGSVRSYRPFVRS